MATNFKNKVLSDVGTTPETIISAGATAKNTIIGLSLTNTTEGVILASIALTDDLGATGYFLKNIPIPPNQSLRVINGGEKLVMAENNLLAASADRENAADVIVSYVEIV